MARTKIGQGQTALVTGASTGIGVDLAACFAKDGYDLILCARTESTLREVAAQLAQAYKVKATPIACDLGAPGGGTRLAGEIEAQGQRRRPGEQRRLWPRRRLHRVRYGDPGRDDRPE